MKHYRLTLFIALLLGFNLYVLGQTSSATKKATPTEVIVDLNKDVSLREDIYGLANMTSEQLRVCCAAVRGRATNSITDVTKVTQNTKTEAYTIFMKTEWYGFLTGQHYWISGKLLLTADGNTHWRTLKKSAGISAGCADNCVE